MRNIILISLIVLSSCSSTQKSTQVHDDVYDVASDRSSSDVYYDENESNYRSYNDIVYNDPWRYNSYRFGFGVGIGSPLYYGPYWGNSWYWGNPYGYYNPWNSSIYYNPWGYYGYGWSSWTHYHHHGFYGCNTDFGHNSHIVSPRPNMIGRSAILNNTSLNNHSLLRPHVDSPKTTNTYRPIKSNDHIRTSPPPPNRVIRNNPPRVNSPRNDRSVPRSPGPRSPNRPTRR